MRTKFRNWRRESNRDGDHDSKKVNDDKEDDRNKTDEDNGAGGDDSKEDDAEYENNKDLISQEWRKSERLLSVLKDLMDKTYKRRRDWITGSCPSALNVLETYSCLESGIDRDTK